MSANQYYTNYTPESQIELPRRLEPTLHFPRPVRVFMRDEHGIRRIVLIENTAVVLALVRAGWTFAAMGGAE